ncbi:ATP-binding cassette domain-containing protein [Shinella sp. HZN7]|uniref:ATP-binding cassette domain-containing protein n=1 Tax=Shinella sp. (strain HZN7) TaxID=879274 RepID=UPI0007DAAF2A|nr:hypothetical protein shn_33135 [Shinella sp. HZN7]
MTTGDPVIRFEGVGLRYGKVHALSDVNLEVPSGCMAGLIGPDGVGKSSLLALAAGVRRMQTGRIEVLGCAMFRPGYRAKVGPRIAYMPQGLGRNLCPTLSVRENIDFVGRLFGHDATEPAPRIEVLTRATGLYPFLDRPTGKLSGGMKQKLGLCSALIHDPDLLILDELTTGVDPRGARGHERAGRHRLHGGNGALRLARGDGRRPDPRHRQPKGLLRATGAETLDTAFLCLLPEEKCRSHRPVEIVPRNGHDGEPAIEAHDLTMRFGDFTAVSRVQLSVKRGEIFGFLGSNGCGKTTMMKMMTRRRVGYMSQSFSLSGELTVAQNLTLHARLFARPEPQIAPRVEEMLSRFDLAEVRGKLPDRLPLGVRQRLSLAVALIHTGLRC